MIPRGDTIRKRKTSEAAFLAVWLLSRLYHAVYGWYVPVLLECNRT